MTTRALIFGAHHSARSALSEGMRNHCAAKLGADTCAYRGKIETGFR